ncbi:unnamed protein product [Parnassius mnemosyne]|uniref:Integrase catalytic domain-containing protein n=1 Tax=Parnassius mnemosyne TaxID=213953 RepID=A0AAV1KFD5_9NEOP
MRALQKRSQYFIARCIHIKYQRGRARQQQKCHTAEKPDTCFTRKRRQNPPGSSQNQGVVSDDGSSLTMRALIAQGPQHLMGPLPSNEYLLVVVDYYSRYKEVNNYKNIISLQIIKMVKEMFSRLGYPISITADNGKQFVSEEFRPFCKECNIKLQLVLYNIGFK